MGVDVCEGMGIIIFVGYAEKNLKKRVEIYG